MTCPHKKHQIATFQFRCCIERQIPCQYLSICIRTWSVDTWIQSLLCALYDLSSHPTHMQLSSYIRGQHCIKISLTALMTVAAQNLALRICGRTPVYQCSHLYNINVSIQSFMYFIGFCLFLHWFGTAIHVLY